jgi:hypothetical protein
VRWPVPQPALAILASMLRPRPCSAKSEILVIGAAG